MLRRVIDRITNNWALKTTAFALAFLLWTTVRRDSPGEWETDVDVVVQNGDGEWVVGEVLPERISVVLSGPYGELLRAASERPQMVIPVDRVADPTEVHMLRSNWLRMPAGTENTSVAEFRPVSVRIVFDRVATRLIPLAATFRNSLPSGYELEAAPRVEPRVVRANGARRMLDRIDSLRLPVIDLAQRRRTDSVELTVDTTGTGLIISPRRVRVIVPIRPALSDTGALPLNTQQPAGRRPGG